MWAVCTPAGQVPSQTASVESGRRGHAGQDSTAGGGLAAGLTSALTARGAEPPPATEPSQQDPSSAASSAAVSSV